MTDIHLLERYTNWWYLLYFLLGLLSLAAAYAAIQYGNRTARAKEAEASVKLKAIENQRIELQAKLESAIGESRRAEAELADAQSSLADKQCQLADTQKRLADADRKRAEAQLILEKTLDSVRERQMPRTLSAEQRSHLVGCLGSNSASKISIETPVGDSEARAFATELIGVLRAAAWEIEEQSFNAIYMSGIPSGIVLVVRDPKRAPRQAVCLQQALSEVGLSIHWRAGANLPEGKTILRVGTKP